MNIQEVFNKVIEAGIYDPSNKAIDSCKDFMCNALEEARLWYYIRHRGFV